VINRAAYRALIVVAVLVAWPAYAVDESADMEMFEKWDRECKKFAVKHIPQAYLAFGKPNNAVWARMPRWVKKRLNLCIKTGVRIIAE
jgi:hypothetical protein